MRNALGVFTAPGQVTQCPGVILLRRGTVPLDRLLPALLHALAALVTKAQAALACRIPLLCRLRVPLDGKLQILSDARTEFQTPAQLRLRRAVAQPGGRLIPLHRLSRVYFHAPALPVGFTQLELCPRKALFRRLAEALQRLGVVLLHADGVCIAIAQIRQGRHIILHSRLGVQQHRLLWVCLHADTGLQAPPQIGQPPGVTHSRGPLIAGQRLGVPLLLHGQIAQHHPVIFCQILFHQRREKGAPTMGAEIRLCFRKETTVRIFTTIIVHS